MIESTMDAEMVSTEPTAEIMKDMTKKKKSPKKSAKSAKKAIKAKYARGAKPKAAKGTQGQNGEAIELPWEKLNDDEKKLLRATFKAKGDREPFAIKTLQGYLTPGKIKDTSRTRNALRRLVRGGWYEKYERGTYRWTDKGRKRGLGKD